MKECSLVAWANTQTTRKLDRSLWWRTHPRNNEHASSHRLHGPSDDPVPVELCQLQGYIVIAMAEEDANILKQLE